MPRTITIEVPVGFELPRPETHWTALGRRLHPEAVTAAWYAAGCPPNFKPPVPLGTFLRWRISYWLRRR